LSHGFPYDVHAFDEVAPILAREGARVILPYARGFGSTTFISDEAVFSGQQAARGLDIIQLTEALGLNRPILGGFDWGGNASCVAAALWPEHVSGLVSYAGYDIIDVSSQHQPALPSLERVFWYQHLFQNERGRECLRKNRRDLCKLLWREWSPGWAFDPAIFDRTAASFDNPNFVDVVIQTYRWSFGLEEGDPELKPLEDRLATKPEIKVPSVTIDGTADPLKPGGTAHHAALFAGRHEHRVLETGHNAPKEEPAQFADAVLTVRGWL
jgi:pimeloyl-ACP methyl ester carboxylesterase